MSDVQNMLQTVLESIRPTVQQIAGRQIDTSVTFGLPAPFIVAVPDGLKPHNLTADLLKHIETLAPLRRRGTATFQELESFIAWTNRHKGSGSVIFADTGKEPSLTTIIDYNLAGAAVENETGRDPLAQACVHRGHYRFPLSDEWKIWSEVSGKPMSNAELGEFIEANAKDLVDPTPPLLNPGQFPPEAQWETDMIAIAQKLQGRFGQYATLAALSRNFVVNETSNISATLNRDTGESTVQFLNEHRQPDGAPIAIPNLFMVGIPVFDHGPLYRLPVRFRYRKAGSEVRWILSLHNADLAFRDAVDGAIAAAEGQTELPLFCGKPETVART